MQQGRTFTPAAKAASIGSSFPPAGKPARPCAPSAGPNTMLPLGVSYGRDTMLSGSSLGDSVSQRGEAIGSLIPREADIGQRSGHVAGRTAYFSDGQAVISSRHAWRPPAGLPVPGSNGTTVSCNSSSSGAGSIGRSSNYAEASAAASFYKQRQQQHSPCIFGDGSDYASSVARYVPPDQAPGAEFRLQQRVPFLQEGYTGSHCSRSGRQQNLQSDTMRAAGVPTATWHAQQEQQQQQRKLLQTPAGMAQSLQESQSGANLSESTEPQLKPSPQICAEETLRLQAHYQQPRMDAGQQLEQTHPQPGEDAAPAQQWQRENASTGAASRVQGLTDLTFSNESSQCSTRRQQKHEENKLSTDGAVQDETQDPAREGTSPLLLCQSSNTQSEEVQDSAVEFVNPPEGSTASSGNHSTSPDSSSTPQLGEHETEVQRRQRLQQHQPQLHEMPGAEDEMRPHSSDLVQSDKTPAEEAFEAAASLSTHPPHSNLCRWQGKAEEESGFSALRGSRHTPTPRGSKGLDASSFVPREDPRSSREKQIQALRSTGSVMPVSVTADAAVAAAAAAASLRCHGNTSGGRNSIEGGAGDTGVSGSRTSSRAGPPETQADPYPLNLMGKGSEHAGRRATARAGCARLLPLDIPWHSSAASALRHREYLSHANTGQGAGSSPTSNGSRGLFSPASSNCSQAPYGQQLTARERLLHQHCTSSVFADEEEDTSEAGNRPVPQKTLPFTTAATSHRALRLQECEYGTKDENLQRRADQLQNPWYSDLFGRQTPKRSPTAARGAAAAVLANAPECEPSSPREGEDTQGAAAPAAGNSILGVDGATLDKLCAHRRKAQLLRAPNAYERFISAMQSDIWSNVGGDGDAVTQKRLMRAHLAKEMLLQEKCREQRRRQRLKEAVKDGHGKYFHMTTSDEARVGEMGKDVGLLGLQMKRALPPKSSDCCVVFLSCAHPDRLVFQTAELHLFGMRPDMTEEDIEKLCREGGGGKAEKDGEAESTSGTTAQTDGGVKRNRGLPKCSLQVKLATNILTSQCKGTGKVILQYQENEVDIEQVVRRLREANVGVRQVS